LCTFDESILGLELSKEDYSQTSFISFFLFNFRYSNYFVLFFSSFSLGMPRFSGRDHVHHPYPSVREVLAQLSSSRGAPAPDLVSASVAEFRSLRNSLRAIISTSPVYVPGATIRSNVRRLFDDNVRMSRLLDVYRSRVSFGSHGAPPPPITSRRNSF
jgi:hypothetical protein